MHTHNTHTTHTTHMHTHNTHMHTQCTCTHTTHMHTQHTHAHTTHTCTQRTCTHTTHMPAPLHRHPSACGCACAGQARAAGRHGGEQPAVRAGDGQAAPANARADGALTRRPSSGGGWLLLLLLWWWWCLFCIAACVGWLLDRRCHRFTQFKPQCAFSPTRSFPFPSFGLAVTCLYFSLSLSLSSSPVWWQLLQGLSEIGAEHAVAQRRTQQQQQQQQQHQ